jgi:hypothetical protein
MMKKNILNVAFLATLSSLGFVNLFSADDSTKYWKYGTIASAGVGVVGTIGCLYKISQMKKNSWLCWWRWVDERRNLRL